MNLEEILASDLVPNCEACECDQQMLFESYDVKEFINCKDEDA
jgi:hypothetical protein